MPILCLVVGNAIKGVKHYKAYIHIVFLFQAHIYNRAKVFYSFVYTYCEKCECVYLYARVYVHTCALVCIVLKFV